MRPALGYPGYPHTPKPPRYVSRKYPPCIPHVFRMYPACILITSEDTCISHVSRMYPACLLHIRYISLWMRFEIHVSMHVSHHVFRMYPKCILITLADTCISHVSRMYPACILHLRYVPLSGYIQEVCISECIPNVFTNVSHMFPHMYHDVSCS